MTEDIDANTRSHGGRRPIHQQSGAERSGSKRKAHS
jgi:hypothetical protein